MQLWPWIFGGEKRQKIGCAPREPTESIEMVRDSWRAASRCSTLNPAATLVPPSAYGRGRGTPHPVERPPQHRHDRPEVNPAAPVPAALASQGTADRLRAAHHILVAGAG